MPPSTRATPGGALVSTRGELIGINSQILSPSGGNIGIGFAIPANMARNVMTQLIDKGRVHRGLLGVTVQPMTSELARSLDIEQVTGALVSDVQPGGPGEKGGLRRGDVITSIDGEPVRDGNVLRNHVAELQPGTRVELQVLRSGKPQTLTLTLGELAPARGSADDAGSRRTRDGTGFGMSVQPLTQEQARQLELDVTSGVLVTGRAAIGPCGRRWPSPRRRHRRGRWQGRRQVDSAAVAAEDRRTGRRCCSCIATAPPSI